MSKTTKSTISVNKIFSSSGQLTLESGNEEQISVHEFKTEPAEVAVALGVTINTGNFSSVRIDVTCRVPSYIEELDDAYKFAYSFAEDRVQAEVDNVRGVGTSKKTDSSPL